MAPSTFEKVIGNVGYVSTTDFMLKFAAPILLLSIGFGLVIALFLPIFPSYYGYAVMAIGALFVGLYPVALYERKKVDINEKMHLMITYAGTLSTIDIQRSILFGKLAEKKENFGEIAKTAEKILYFAKSWNLGFSKSARKVGSLLPSEIFADFLDRFAIMMDFGEDLKTFLTDEQDAVMDDFAAEYHKSLESIKMLQEIFVSLTMTIAFVMSTSMLLPLIAGYSMEVVVRYSLLAVIAMDIFLFVFVRTFIPGDRLLHDLPVKDEGLKQVIRLFYILTPVSILLTMLLLKLNFLPFLFDFAIGFLPLLAVGIMAQNHEQVVFSRDLAFPSYIRALGSAVEVRMGAMVSSLRNLQVHDFGVLNEMSVNLYRRLRLGSDKGKSWMLFAAESGSYLIAKFSQIFSEGVYMGGNAEKIGEIISKNFNRILQLRKQRLQLASGVRGAFYGSLVGFAAASYISVKITQLLSVIFSAPFANLSSTTSDMADIVSALSPASALSINFDQVAIYIGIMVIFHAIISAVIIKIVEGGNNYAALFDLIIMLWIGAILSWVLPKVIDSFLPSFAGDFGLNATNSTNTTAGGVG